MNEVSDFVFIADLHIQSHSNVRVGDVIQDIKSKLEFVVNYCNENNAVLLLGGDVFDKPTVPDFVKNIVCRELIKASLPIYAIPGNHDVPYRNEELLYKTSYALCESVNLYETLKTIEFSNVILTSEVPLITRGKPQICIFHGFLNIEDGPNTFRFQDIQTTDNTYICLGHDHVEYEVLRYMNNVSIFRIGSFLRTSRVETNFRQPKLLHIKVVNGALKHKLVAIPCRDAELVFSVKKESIKKSEKEASYDDLINKIRESSNSQLTLEQGLRQVTDEETVLYILSELKNYKDNINNKRI